MAVGDKCPSPDSSNGRYRSLLHTSGRGSQWDWDLRAPGVKHFVSFSCFLPSCLWDTPQMGLNRVPPQIHADAVLIWK